MLDESKKILAGGVELLNVGSKIIHKKGVVAVFQLSDEAMALGTLDVVKLRAEWPVGSLKANVTELSVAAKAKLDLENKEVQAKIGGLLDLAVTVFGVVDDVLKYVAEVKAVLKA